MVDLPQVTGMTAAGWALLGTAWGIVFCLMGWCYYRVMTMPSLDSDGHNDVQDDGHNDCLNDG